MIDLGASDEQVDARARGPAPAPDAESESGCRRIEVGVTEPFSWLYAHARSIGSANGINRIVPVEEQVVIAAGGRPLVPLQICATLGAVWDRHCLPVNAGRELQPLPPWRC